MSLLMKRTLLLKFLSLNDFPFQVNNELVDEAYAVAKLGLVINGSISFFLYCFSGRRFREELFKIMGWNCTSDDEDDTCTSNSYSVEQTRKPSYL
jgi:hypothetical protein